MKLLRITKDETSLLPSVVEMTKYKYLSRVVVIYLLSFVWLFCKPMDCSPPDCSVHGISQTRILEWVANSFSRGSSQHSDQTHISCLGRRILYHWATREAPSQYRILTQKGREGHSTGIIAVNGVYLQKLWIAMLYTWNLYNIVNNYISIFFKAKKYGEDNTKGKERYHVNTATT